MRPLLRFWGKLTGIKHQSPKTKMKCPFPVWVFLKHEGGNAIPNAPPRQHYVFFADCGDVSNTTARCMTFMIEDDKFYTNIKLHLSHLHVYKGYEFLDVNAIYKRFLDYENINSVVFEHFPIWRSKFEESFSLSIRVVFLIRRWYRIAKERFAKKTAAIMIIQRMWRKCISNPSYTMCRRRLMYEWSSLSQ